MWKLKLNIIIPVLDQKLNIFIEMDEALKLKERYESNQSKKKD